MSISHTSAKGQDPISPAESGEASFALIAQFQRETRREQNNTDPHHKKLKLTTRLRKQRAIIAMRRR